MKNEQEIDALMQQIPAEYRHRWCGGEKGPCACLGCVQICNRAIMVEVQVGHPFYGDPEYIDEAKIHPEVYTRLKITREEWENWKARSANKQKPST